MLLLIAFLGQKFIGKLKWASSSSSIFKKVLGVLFLLVGVSIITGFDKTIETYVLDSGYINTTNFEQQFIDKVEIE